MSVFPIKKDALDNIFYRKVIFTSHHMQIVLMAIDPRDEIGLEVHPHIDQYIQVIKGNGIAQIEENRYSISADDAIIIPSGMYHNIINRSDSEYLQLYTIYSSPQHPPNITEIIKYRQHNTM